MPRSRKRSTSPKKKKEDAWYYLLGGEVERGPVTTSELQSLKRTGRLHDETLVRRAAKGEKRTRFLPRSLTRRRSKTSPTTSKKRKWSPYYRTVPGAHNRFDSVGLFPDLPPTALEQKALRSMLASIS